VPKKKKITQAKENASPDAAPKGRADKAKLRRAVAGRKPRETSLKKTAVTGEAPISVDAPRTLDPSDETIRLRAYFISERRRRFALPGDAESDWLEARRQLLAEAGNGGDSAHASGVRLTEDGKAF
jgi:hypothetical protein